MLKWFKKQPKQHTAIHPEYKKLVEKVFSIDGVDYYEFKNLLDMPHKRFNSAVRFWTEFEMRIDAKELKTLIDQSMKHLDEGNVTRSIIIQNTIKERTELLISIECSWRLASCVYFTKDESLDDYDYDIGDEKIKAFKKVGLESFFLSEPFNRFLPDLNLSSIDLMAIEQLEKGLKTHESVLNQRLKNLTD